MPRQAAFGDKRRCLPDERHNLLLRVEMGRASARNSVIGSSNANKAMRKTARSVWGREEIRVFGRCFPIKTATVQLTESVHTMAFLLYALSRYQSVYSRQFHLPDSECCSSGLPIPFVCVITTVFQIIRFVESIFCFQRLSLNGSYRERRLKCA